MAINHNQFKALPDIAIKLIALEGQPVVIGDELIVSWDVLGHPLRFVLNRQHLVWAADHEHIKIKWRAPIHDKMKRQIPSK